MTMYAVYRSDCSLAANPQSFVDNIYTGMAFMRAEADHPDLLQLKRLCEFGWGREFQFVIVPISTLRNEEPPHWNKDGWRERFARNNGYPLE